MGPDGADMMWLVRLWKWQQRRVDMQTLWPQIQAETRDIVHARSIFRYHMEDDEAYSLMTSEEKNAYVAKLV